MNRRIFLAASVAALFAVAACTKDAYVLKEGDIKVDVPQGGFTAVVNEPLRVHVSSVSDEGVMYSWSVDGEFVSAVKELDYAFDFPGEYELRLDVSQGKISLSYAYPLAVSQGEGSPYVASVLEYCPAPGQFVNELPLYESGDTADDMRRKAFESIGYGRNGLISLGSFGGYVTVGFDHTIPNRPGLMDIRILGNAFGQSGDAAGGGSSEPGVVWVSKDANGNGIADDQWYEIAGSASADPSNESWWQQMTDLGYDTRTLKGYTITYNRPADEPQGAKEEYISWQDALGGSGYVPKISAHRQPYYPQWVVEDELSFTGTRLPQNGYDKSGSGTMYFLWKFAYGYADNDSNTSPGSCIDIDWAVGADGAPAGLDGVDFVRVQSGVNQINGWVGECSSEVMGVSDLHALGETVPSGK